MATAPVLRSSRIKRKGDEVFEKDEQNGVVDERTPTSNKKRKLQNTAKPITRKQPQGGWKKGKGQGKWKEKEEHKVTKKFAILNISDTNDHNHDDHNDHDDHDDPPETKPDEASSPSPAPPDAPQLTDAYVRSLLPGSMFGLADDLFARGLWGVAHEHALRHRRFAASPDFTRFQEEQMRMFQTEVPDGMQGPFDAELRLWEVLQHRFRCNLDDLFRYGLRPHHRGGGNTTFTNYCVKLTAILVHPLWAANIAHVRWLLQRVVQERVPGYARPLVPPYSYHRQPFAATARQWGFDASMRMSLEEEEAESAPSTKSKPTTTATKATTTQRGDGHFLHRLATASHEAVRAAAEAEAELAWFFFAASAPRDLWYLDRQLKHQDEPGSGSGGGGDVDEDQEEEDEMEEEDNPFGLAVCDDILQGHFGKLAPSYDGHEVTVRQDLRRREDNLVHRMGRLAINDKKDDGADLSNEQVFFDLCIQDLDRLLRLLALPEFCAKGGFVTPECYYGGYIKAHALHGYGKGGERDQEGVPLLTCLQCAQKYHQNGGPEDIEDSDDEHHHNHDHDHEDASGDHGHYLHQQFVRDVDSERALEWLLHRKCEWLLAGCREQLIRASLWAGERFNRVPIGDGRALLPDIPPFDPPPLAWMDRVFTHPSQLAVLARAQDVPHASVLWCLREDEEEMEEN